MTGMSYQQLEARFTRLHRYAHLGAMAGWDQLTMMPEGGSEARAEAMAELSVLMHDTLTSPEVRRLLDDIDPSTLEPEQQANLREMRREVRDATVMPAELVEAQSLAGARCESVWRTCRPNNDWQGFLPTFREVVRLSREEARIRAEALGCGRYEALLQKFEPGLTLKALETIFDDMRQWLPGLLSEAVECQRGREPVMPQGPFGEDDQRRLGERVMAWLGFDFDHGRLDVSLHPFCGGVPDDVRLTTRYRSDECLTALMGIIHETGHARYEQNLPLAWHAQPAGRARSMAVHESQSLSLEMQLGRSAPFIRTLQPWLVETLGDQPAFEVENLIHLAQQVEPGLIRVDADEVSYPAHILLRFDIERALIEGEIEVEDIPERWDEGMQRLLGLDTRGNYRDGCLQDIHWTDGSFGYFPTYSLGAMLAAQLMAAARRAEPQLDARIADGDPGLLLEWLKSHVWQQGSLMETSELIQRATGEALDPEYYRRHLRERYVDGH
ncbi:carboxypeptidase M32 [Kushneria sp. EE4]